YELVQYRFYEILDNLCAINSTGADYLANIPFEQWTQLYNGGLWHKHMITNLAECINSVLKRMHHLPITSIFKET
ncbi:hypothetical protein J1N35_035251, partial [Gossypium stocksii]